MRELALDVDDRLIIMGSGDEMRLRFRADSAAPLPTGWTRDFLLKVDGWAKDRDPNTAFSSTVEPLPFHAMSRYPYPAGEHFPNDAEHDRYRQRVQHAAGAAADPISEERELMCLVSDLDGAERGLHRGRCPRLPSFT